MKLNVGGPSHFQGMRSWIQTRYGGWRRYGSQSQPWIAPDKSILRACFQPEEVTLSSSDSKNLTPKAPAEPQSPCTPEVIGSWSRLVLFNRRYISQWRQDKLHIRLCLRLPVAEATFELCSVLCPRSWPPASLDLLGAPDVAGLQLLTPGWAGYGLWELESLNSGRVTQSLIYQEALLSGWVPNRPT